MSDIVLVYPRTGMDIGSTVAPPHSLLAVAAPLEEVGYKVKIIDQRVDKNWKLDLLDELSRKPLFMGISTMTGTQVKFAIEIARLTRDYVDGAIPIVWGGPHPTLLPEQTLESGWADVVCVGEGDETIFKLACVLEKGPLWAKRVRDSLQQVEGVAYLSDSIVVRTTPSPLANMERLLPTPWHLINVEEYIHPDIYLKGGRNLDVGQTSRGCPFNCGFCSSASIRQRKWRPFSAERSISMITETVRRFKLTGIWLRDDEFFVNSERAAKIAEGIIPLGIHWYTSGTRVDTFNRMTEEQLVVLGRSGANVLKFGAESGSNRLLELMDKGITREETLKANLKAKRYGITPAFALMLGFPTETFGEMEETISLAKHMRRDNPKAQFETMAVYTALPGTPMWKMALEYGLKPPQKLEEWIDWNFDEYDPEGKRIPWFNKKERQAIGNLCYISMLSNAVPNVIDSLSSRIVSKVLQGLYALPHKYYQWRFFGRHYKWTGELNLVRMVRQKLFYNGRKSDSI